MSKGPLVTDGDLKEAASATAFAADAIERHMSSEMYRNAVTANEYYRQHNVTINRFVQKIYSCSGAEAEDFTASKLRLASNLFKRLNVQRCTYSLGKGVSFVDVSAGGKDTTKEGLGDRFDDDVMEMGLKALIHGVSFPFWNLDHIDVFTADEFCPVWDEYSGALYAGVRFWRLDSDHPWHATLYEQDGYTEMVSGGSGFDFEVAEAKRAYKVTYQEIPADGMKLAVDAENYSRLPIVAVWGSDAHQSTLVGMRESIDAYDLIKSGLVNDTRDCAQIYWLINGAGGMDDRDLDLWRAKLKLTHVAEVDAEQGQSVTPYTQEVPVEGRKETLAQIKADIYEDFGALGRPHHRGWGDQRPYRRGIPADGRGGRRVRAPHPRGYHGHPRPPGHRGHARVHAHSHQQHQGAGRDRVPGGRVSGRRDDPAKAAEHHARREGEDFGAQAAGAGGAHGGAAARPGGEREGCPGGRRGRGR